MTFNHSKQQGYHNRFSKQQVQHQGRTFPQKEGGHTVNTISPTNHQQDASSDHMYNEMMHDIPDQNMLRAHSLPQQSEDSKTKKYMAIKSHGKNTAIEVAPDLTMKEWYTIKIEGAAKINDQSKAYDWKNKISIQMTKTELPLVIGVLLGYLPEVEFKNHGDSNKGVAIQNQGKNFYFKIMELSGKCGKPRLHVCPVPVVEAHLMGMLGLTEYVKNFEGMTTDAALSAIKVMCIQLYKNDAYPKVTQKK